jgi:hypothetical protein
MIMVIIVITWHECKRGNCLVRGTSWRGKEKGKDVGG